MTIAKHLKHDVQYHANRIAQLTIARMAAHLAGIEEEVGFVALPGNDTGAYEFHIIGKDLRTDYFRLLPVVTKFEKQPDDAGGFGSADTMFVGNLVGTTTRFKLILHVRKEDEDIAHAWADEGQLEVLPTLGDGTVVVEAVAGV